jgi:two-component system response regulator AtoC
VIDEADLPGWVRQAPERRAAPLVAGGEEPQGTLDDVERGYILQVLTSTGWNRSRAAQILGIDRRTLFTRIQRYGLVLPSE